MPPASNREAILDAYEQLLVAEGERAATVEAVARAAGVSKGGLLYHFASKDELADAAIERLLRVARADAERATSSPEGVIEVFLRGAVQTGDPLDVSLGAVHALQQSGRYPQAKPALDAVVQGWVDLLSEGTGDPVLGRLVAVLGDGLYFGAAFSSGHESGVATPPASPQELDELIAAVQQLATLRGARR
jgi:AcrR family transcriptional regulator